MRKIFTSLIAIAVMAGPATAQDQETPAQKQDRESAADSGPLLPKRLILIWDPVQRDLNGTPTGRIFQVPNGWQLCDGTNGTPDLANRFVKGIKSLAEAGQTGGRADIPTQPPHRHEVDQVSLSNRGFGDDNLDNRFRNRPDGGHNHGGVNEPPFMALAYICRFQD